MHRQPRQTIRWFAAAFAAVLLVGAFAPAAAGPRERPLFVAVGEVARPPIGWVQFCVERPWECRT